MIVTFSLQLFPQEQKQFNLNVDFSRFRYDTTSSYLELYYSFQQSQFELTQSGDNFSGSAIISLKIHQKNSDSILVSKKWRAPFIIQDTSNLKEKMLIGVTGFKIPFGEYIAIVDGKDEKNPSMSTTLKFEFKSTPFDKKSVIISDPELCSSIQQIEKDENNIFYKNTLEVIPNPALVYGIGLPIIFVYAEIYNLDVIKSQTFRYILDIFDYKSKKVKSSSKPKKKQYESSVEVSTINCSDLPSGAYILRCSIVDELDTTNRAFSFKKLFIYNPHIASEKISGSETDLISNEYAMMTEEEINREIQIAKYLADKNEIDEFEKTKSLEGKKNVMINFWKKRNTDPSGLSNVAKEKFTNSVNYVNTHFRTGQREGWKTDRGRVFIIYGQPDEIERHPNEIDSKPYEIWYFNNLEGGVIFVFVDKSTMGDYTLVHSTYRNELRDDNWQRFLK
jgi:GWxTD domain-containing protein